MMKKQIRSIIIMMIAIIMLAGCTTSNNVEPTATAVKKVTATATQKPVATQEPVVTQEPVFELDKDNPVKIATLVGPTGMGLIELIDDESGVFDVSLFTAPDQLIPKIINGEIDIASIPANLASILYKKMQGEISILSVNTLGVLYIVENGDTVTKIEDLKGKTIYVTGQGATPEYVLNEMLVKSGLVVGVDVEVVYLAQHADLANQVAAGDIKIALLPEPFVSTVTMKNADVKVKVSLNDVWKKVYGDVDIPMSATIVNNKYLAENEQAVWAMLDAYEDSINFVNDNINEASTKMVKHGIIGSEAIAQRAIPRCMISFIHGVEAQEMLEQYFQVSFDANPASIGGEVPNEEIYYKR